MDNPDSGMRLPWMAATLRVTHPSTNAEETGGSSADCDVASGSVILVVALTLTAPDAFASSRS